MTGKLFGLFGVPVLANVEKTLKTRDLGIRPIRHYTENRTRAQVFLCMLAARLTGGRWRQVAPTVELGRE